MLEPPVRVLLIEDDEDDYILVKDLFQSLPVGAYTLDRVADFPSALHALRNCRHDVYLVDYRLGQHTGLEVLAAAQRLGCEAPIIMLTGQREREVDLLAMQAGATDFLVKDQLNGEQLERAIRYSRQQKRHEEAIRRVNQQLEERVSERTAELARVNDSLQAEIAERKRIEAALLEADERKDQFLATLAHELRNPLSPLTTAAQLIELETDRSDQVRELSAIMTRQLEQLRRLVDDLLDVSRISRGKLRLRRESLQLGEAIAVALDVVRPLISASGHALDVHLPAEPLVLDGDKVRLSQAIGNLLINAAKYTPAGGRILLSVVAEGGWVVVAVRDNGIGIPREMLPRIFDLFAQVDPSATRAQGGLGIGLTLVKTLVEMHGGAVSVQSDGAGQGSEFTIRLPLATSASAAAAKDKAANGPLPRLRVLVVDDNQSASHLLSRLLGKLGQETRVANSAEEALAIVPQFRPDLVISDIAMPGTSGLDLAAKIRGLPLDPAPVLVALTGYGQDTDRQESLAVGFQQHLTKPIGLAALETLLASIVPARGNGPPAGR
ncbi:MAG: response regulator [Pirellulaceae bacterium]|nr:response regulator [Pirellulaceae bacterium]